MDGDGLGDAVYVTSGGALSVALNLGGGSFTSFRTMYTFADFDANSARFMDINGDGRADYVYIESDGTIGCWLNYRSGSMLELDFRDSSIIMHPISGAHLTAQNMTFGRIRGTRKVDLATLHYDGAIKLYENRGYNGIAYGEYVRYCDMTNSGSDSYLTMGPTGSMKMYQNLHDGTIHLKRGQILGDQGVNRADVHLADLDGDGKCDYIVVNNKTGALSASMNQGLSGSGNTSTLSLSGRSSLVTSGGSLCDRTGVRFADINGDGKADYICISRSGDVSIGINNGGNSFSIGGTVFSASSELLTVGGRDPITFADIDGDGHADYLAFDSKSGSVMARLNQNGGQSFGSASTIYTSSSFVDGNLIFANVNGLGRADMINVQMISAKAKQSSNRCPAPTPPKIGSNPNQPVGSDGGDNGTDGNGNNGSDDDGVDDLGEENDDGSASGSSNNDDGDGDEDWQPCSYSHRFGSLAELNGAAAGIRSDCLAIHSMQVLNDMLITAYNNYSNVNNGYDQEFDYYVTYMKKLIPTVAAYEFMFNGSTTSESQIIDNVGFGMQYFSCQNGGDTFPCTQITDDNHLQEAEDNPTTFTLQDNDGYTKGLVSVGLDPSWVVFGDFTLERVVQNTKGTTVKYNFHNFPVLNQSIVIANPKDIVTKGLGSIPDLQFDLASTWYEMMLGLWINGTLEDAPSAYSTPVFMLMQAIDSMQQVKTLGQQEQQEEEAEANQWKDIVLLIVGVLLIFVPVVGEEFAAAAGLATLARAISITGELGNAALGLYDSVQDPNSALVNCIALLFGVGNIIKATRDAPGISSIARARAGLSDDTIASIGSVFKDNDNLLKSIGKVCKWDG